MRTQHQNDVKVAVYCANVPAPDEQASQDVWLAIFMAASALAIVWLRCLV